MKKIATILAGAASALPALAWGQEAGSAAAAAGTGMSLGQFIQAGGWLMYPIGVLSIIGLAMILYFFVVLRQEGVVPQKFVGDLRPLLLENRWTEAHAICRQNTSALAAVLGAALDYRLHTDRPDTALLGEIVEGEGSRQATMIQNQVQYLADIGGIAPMMGLLGTVLGMVKAFNAVALDLAKAKPILLAEGVSQALITTVGGLVVAIPAMIAYAYFRGRSAKIISNLESSSADLVTLVARER